MKVLSMILLFIGYTLVYAAVAKSGKFATDPWAALAADAYTDETIGGTTTATTTAAAASTNVPPLTPTKLPSTPAVIQRNINL